MRKATGSVTDSKAASTALARRLAAIIAIVAATAVAVQLGMNLARAVEQGKPLWMVPIDLFGYFTIWTNTLVALVTARFARGGDSAGLLGRPWVLAAAVVYIVVVGVIYNTLLAQYNPQVGVRRLLDLIFHTVIPLAYPLWWLTQVPRGRLGWNALLPTLAFPLAYCFAAMAKGAITGRYAYFFIDLDKYGLVQVLLNSAGLAALYALLMAVVIAYDRWAGGTIAVEPAE